MTLHDLTLPKVKYLILGILSYPKLNTTLNSYKVHSLIEYIYLFGSDNIFSKVGRGNQIEQ